MLVNKLRDSAKKVSDHIDFQGEMSSLTAADADQAGLKELTGLDTPVISIVPPPGVDYASVISQDRRLALLPVLNSNGD